MTMKKLFFTLWWVGALWFGLGELPAVVDAQQQQQSVPSSKNDNTKSQVTLSLDEFQELFASARLQDAERRALEQRKRQTAEHERQMEEMKQQQERKDKEMDEEHAKMFPDHFEVLEYTAFGTFNSSSPTSGVEGDVVSFDLDLTVRIMDSPSPKWTLVPLVNTSSTVASNFRVSLMDDDREEEDKEGDSSGTIVDTVSDPSTLLLIRNDQQVLATNRSGLFHVRFQVFTRVSKTRNLHVMSLSHLLYPLSDFSLRIAKPKQQSGGGTTSTSNSNKKMTILKDFSIQPASAVLQIDDSSSSLHPPGNKNNTREDDGDDATADYDTDDYTDLHATLPLTADSIQIRWTSVAIGAERTAEQTGEGGDGATAGGTSAQAQKVADDTAPQVTASHQVLHTIGEGILRSSHTLEFKTSNREDSPLGTVSFWIYGDNVRVTSVAAHALQSWSIVDEQSDAATTGSDDDDSQNTKQVEARQLVKAYFKTSQLDSSGVVLQVHTETDRGGRGGEEATSAMMETQLELPRIECRNVLRQTGHIAVIKDANVEVHEKSITPTLSRCEPSDLSSQLRLNVDRPVVLSYKYLNNPQNAAIMLNVKEHTAMETLEAAIDRIHYKALVTPTHTVHSMILIMQSTKLQYLKVMGLPLTASKFTVLVNSESVKPVQGEYSRDEESGIETTQSVLIPLLVGLQTERANEGSTLLTSVELNYFSTHDEPLTSINRINNGTISLDPPQFDLPVSVLTAHLRLPRGSGRGGGGGDTSSSPPYYYYKYKFEGDMGEPSERLEVPAPEPFAYQKGKRVVRKDHQFTIVDDFWPDDDDDDDDNGGKGPKTVQIQTPRSGRSFFFQQYLVVDRKLELTAKYERRRTKPAVSKKIPLWKRVVRLIPGSRRKE